MTKKVFISLPMRNRSLDEIRADMNDIFKNIKSTCFDNNEDVEMIDTLWVDDPTDDILNDSVWYLGRSIKALAEADVAVFDSRWRETWGCIIEHMVCAMYNIPYYDISMDYKDHVDNDVKYCKNLINEVRNEGFDDKYIDRFLKEHDFKINNELYK